MLKTVCVKQEKFPGNSECQYLHKMSKYLLFLGVSPPSNLFGMAETTVCLHFKKQTITFTFLNFVFKFFI